MDRNLRAPRWDFSEPDRETISKNIDMVIRSTNCGSQGLKDHFSVDLKLGSVSHSGETKAAGLKKQGSSKMALSPSGSSKKAKPASSGSAIASCQVDGCTADLSNCRDYNRRYKVCELHSKTPQVLIGSCKQRFCQQCSRFHSLDEFDDGKRSCRKRLDGHNRRRRKPPPQNLPSSSFTSNYPGTGLISFPNSSFASPVMNIALSWAETVASLECKEPKDFPDKPTAFPGSSSCSHRAAKTATFSDDLRRISHNNSFSASDHSPLVKSLVYSQQGGVGHKMPYESDCARSLLSSPPWMQVSTIKLGNAVQPDSVHSTQRSNRSLNYNTLEDSYLVPGASDTNNDAQLC